MALVERNGAHITLQTLFEIGRQIGITEDEIRQVVRRVSGNLADAAHHLGTQFYDDFTAWAEEMGRRPGRNALERMNPNYEDPLLTTMTGRNRHGRETGGASHFNFPPLEQAKTAPMVQNNEIGEQQNMGGRAPEEGGEQQVERPRKIWRRFPNTENAALKYVVTQYLSSNSDTSAPPFDPFDQPDEKTATSLLDGSGGGAISNPSFIGLNTTTLGYDFNNPWFMQFRMTSLYNIIYRWAGSVTSTKGTPVWTELFDQKYQYYHVLETEWQLTLNFGWPNNGTTRVTAPQDFGYYIFWKYTNEDDPVTQYNTGGTYIANTTLTNEQSISAVKMSGALGSQNMTPDDYFRQGGWHHRHVQLNNVKNTEVKINGKYKYGQCKMDIKTISASDAHGNSIAAEGWAKSRTTAVFPENLSIIIVNDNAMFSGGSIKTPVGMRWESEHLVQFKDLVDGYKFPTPGYASLIGANTTLNTDLAFFHSGAGYT